MGKLLWQQRAPVPIQKEDDPQPAEVVAECTREFLTIRGWCLWQCSALNGEIIAVIRGDNVVDVPKGYPVYTEAELEELCRGDVSQAVLRLVHEVKKLTGATVESSTNDGHSDSEVVANSSDDIPQHPTVPCPNYGCGDYWLSPSNEWLCCCCHPTPEESKE